MAPIMREEEGAVFKEVSDSCSASGPDNCPEWQYCNTSSNRCVPCTSCKGRSEAKYRRCAATLVCRGGTPIKCRDLVTTVPGRNGKQKRYSRGFVGTRIEFVCPQSNARLRCVLNKNTLEARWEGNFGCLTETSDPVTQSTFTVPQDTTSNPMVMPGIGNATENCLIVLAIIGMIAALFSSLMCTKAGKYAICHSKAAAWLNSCRKTSEPTFRNSQEGVEHSINGWQSRTSLEDITQPPVEQPPQTDDPDSISLNISMPQAVENDGRETNLAEQTFLKTVDRTSVQHSESTMTTSGDGGGYRVDERGTYDSEIEPLQSSLHTCRRHVSPPVPTEHSWEDGLDDVGARETYSRHSLLRDSCNEFERLPDEHVDDHNADSLLTRTYRSSFSVGEETPLNNEFEDSGISAHRGRIPIVHCMQYAARPLT